MSDIGDDLAVLRAEQEALRLKLSRLDEQVEKMSGQTDEERFAPWSAQPPLPPPMPPPLPPPLPPPAPQVAAPDPTGNLLEVQIGTVWLARVGIVILCAGVVFLASFAWHSFLEAFGPAAKLFLLFLGGGCLAGVGLFLEKQQASLRSYARVLTAGGVAILYYATYAAHYVPSLRVIESPLVGGCLLIVVAAAIAWWADHTRSEVTAGFAIVLAFYATAISPLTHFMLFSNAILGVVAVILMIRRQWVVMPFFALAATYGSYLYWRLGEGMTWWMGTLPSDTSLATRLCFLAFYWIVFTAGVVLSKRIGSAVRVALSILNNAAFFALAAFAIAGAYSDTIWLVSAGAALVMAVLVGVSRFIEPATSLLRRSWVAQGILFAALAVILKVNGAHLAILLAAGCGLLVIAGSFFPSRVLRMSAVLIAVLAACVAGMAIASDASAVQVMAVSGLLLVCAWFTDRSPLGEDSQKVDCFLISSASVVVASMVILVHVHGPWISLTLILLGLLVTSTTWLHRRLAFAGAAQLATWLGVMSLFTMGNTPLPWASLAAILALGTTGALGLLVPGIGSFLRGVLAANGVVAISLFILWVGRHVDPEHQFWLLVGCGTILLGLSKRQLLPIVLSCLLSTSGLICFFHQAMDFPRSFSWWGVAGGLLLLGQSRLFTRLELDPALSRLAGTFGLLALVTWVTGAASEAAGGIPLTVAWAFLGLGVTLAGFFLRDRLLRIGGLGILALSVVRIIAVDVWGFDVILRMVSFLVLGSVLLLLGYLYNRFAEKIREWL